MNHEFEVITDKAASFKIFINVLKYRTPHIHLDYEVGFVMHGTLNVTADNETYTLRKGDFLCVNPCQIHEFSSQEDVQLLLIQVNPSYFSAFYPQILNMEFSQMYFHKDTSNESYRSASNLILQLAHQYMKKPENFELRCAGLLNLLFSDVLSLVPHQYVSNSEHNASQNKADRMRRIADYIEEHYTDKILLSDIANHEHLTLTYLSHFFKEQFHMSFQEYLTKLRCEKARSLILMTDLSLFDISISCGFSDPKYFKNGFRKQYGCSPKEYRESFGNQKLSLQQSSLLTTQQIMSAQTSLVLLQKYIENSQREIAI